MLANMSRRTVRAKFSVSDEVILAAGVLFAMALLFSGQSSTIIATVAGQIVSEGFLNWSISVRPL